MGRIIIVGNGIAGVSALKAIKEADGTSEIYLLGDEGFYPYYRLKLSKSLFGELSEESILIQKKNWYSENNVKIYTGRKAVKVFPDNNELLLSDESRLEYDRLLLANGARNFKPPVEGMDKPGVFTLRTLKDAWIIRNQIKQDDNIIIIGGGIQGLEIAWSLHQQGIKVSIAEVMPRIMPNQLDERASEILKQSIESLGVDVYLNIKADRIIGGECVEGIETNSGEILRCTKVIYSVGIRPNVEIAYDTPLNYGRGIIVNEKMETNIKNIYAAGDVAEFGNKAAGAWNTSMAQGRVAGYNIAGKDSVYQKIIPLITLNAFKLTLFSMGIVNKDEVDGMTVEDNNQGRYVAIFTKNGRIAGAIVIGDTKRSQVLKSAIEQRT